MRTARLAPLVLAAALALAPGCASKGAGPCDFGWTTTLHLSRTSPDGTTVDDAALESFLNDVAVLALPQGFTVVRGEERRRGPDQETPVLRQDVVRLEIVHCEDEASEAAIVRVARAWAERFHQDTILRTDARTHIYW